MDWLDKAIGDVPDFPKPGIIFKDITPVLRDPEIFSKVIDALNNHYGKIDFDHIVAIESRGFIFGAALALKMNKSMVLVRKPGKLPRKTLKESYQLEYGEDTLEIHVDDLEKGDRVIIMDDLLATGGTAAAVSNMVKKLGAEVVEQAFIIELNFLKGRQKLEPDQIYSLVKY